jgi:hypothetical protein
MTAYMHFMCHECEAWYTNEDEPHVCGENGEHVVYPYPMDGPDMLWDEDY